MWKLATKVSLLAVGTVLAVGVAPSYAGTFSGVYSFDNASVAATETLVPVNPDTVNFGSFGAPTGVTGFLATVQDNTGTTNDNFRGQGWTSAFDAARYFSFSVTPTATNKIVDVTSFGFKSTRADATGAPTTWRLDARQGTSGLFTTVFTSSVGALSGTTTQTITQALNNAVLQNVSSLTALQFRLYGYGGNGTGNNSRWTVDDVTLSGTAIPTPAAIPAIIAFGAGLWRKRKQTEMA
jgi:hypothetical protein